jgi:hypothetical protein
MSFAALPPIPQSGLTEAELRLLSAMHQNISLLTGQNVAESKAIISGQVTLTGAPAATTAFPSISGSPANDVAQLATAFQALINDVQSLRDTLNILIAQLRS